MKINKQYIAVAFIIIFGIVAYSFIPSFEREQFNPDVIEDISSGTITTTTLQTNEENESVNDQVQALNRQSFQIMTDSQMTSEQKDRALNQIQERKNTYWQQTMENLRKRP